MKRLKVILKSVNANELMEMVRAFLQYIEIDDDADDVFLYEDDIGKDKIKITVNISNKSEIRKEFKLPADALDHKKLARRYAKIEIYRALKSYLGVSLPYGSLTGVRPTKLFYELQKEGDAEKILREVFDVSAEKASHICRIVNNQKGILSNDENAVDVFVNIPFCPTRCAYCSFVAVAMKQLKKYLENYIYCLKNELSIIKNIINENSYTVRAVYFGGGTPTSIPVHMLQSLIEICDFGQNEFTVEAGRPDTVTEDVLKMLSDNGVTRISVNPQTFHDKTLRLIGRAHTVEDFMRANELAAKYDFIVNTDLIAALPDESLDDFEHSVDCAIKLQPDNITVHNLSLKRGSRLTESNYNPVNYDDAAKMIDYSVGALESADYEPYYMYRQKYNVGSLENSGYSKRGKECIYNIDIMEENCSIMAAGAGAISKRVYKKENRIERLADIKDVKGYIERSNTFEKRHTEFWEKP